MHRVAWGTMRFETSCYVNLGSDSETDAANAVGQTTSPYRRHKNKSHNTAMVEINSVAGSGTALPPVWDPAPAPVPGLPKLDRQLL